MKMEEVSDQLCDEAADDTIAPASRLGRIYTALAQHRDADAARRDPLLKQITELSSALPALCARRDSATLEDCDPLAFATLQAQIELTERTIAALQRDLSPPDPQIPVLQREGEQIARHVAACRAELRQFHTRIERTSTALGVQTRWYADQGRGPWLRDEVRRLALNPCDVAPIILESGIMV